MPAESTKPVTDRKIPGTDVPDVSQAPGLDDRAKRWMSLVAATTAVLATLASLSSMFATNHLNKAMLDRIKASDQWNYFQAKGLKLAIVEGRLSQASEEGKPAPESLVANAQRYRDEQKAIETEARAGEASAEDHLRRQGQLSNASTALQIGIALAAVAILVRRNAFWSLAIVAGLVGAVFMTRGLLPL
jgi:hypothetical protein